MPYPNEHSARISDPGQFEKFARKTITPGVDIILGIKGGKSEAQAYRFDKTKYTVAAAKQWLKENKIKYISFEPATEEKKFADTFQTVKDIFSVGHWEGDDYTEADIDEMIKNFNMLKDTVKVPLKVDLFKKGVVEENVRKRHGGMPACGWVTDLKKIGQKMYAHIENIPKVIKELIDNKAYRQVSSEITWNFKHGDERLRRVLTGVALLGVEIPGVSNLDEFAKIYDRKEEDEEMSKFYDYETIIKKFTEWDTQFINDLPDSCFAYIETGGEKDEDGKTVPRSLRHLPYKDENGKVDIPHLRNALARLSQTGISSEAKASVRNKLIAEAKKENVGEYTKELQKFIEEEKTMDELLVKKYEAEIAAAAKRVADAEEKIVTMQKSHAELMDTTLEERDALLKKLSDSEVSKRTEEIKTFIEKAITDLKVLPAHRELLTTVLTNIDVAKVVKFKRGEKEEDTAITKLFESFITSLPAIISTEDKALTEELKTFEAKDVETAGSVEGQKLDFLVKQYQALPANKVDGKEVAYAVALREVSKKHPDLVG